MAIIGGSKVSSKLKVLENLITKVDIMLVGGGMANTFLAAKGYEIGQSLYEPTMLAAAKALLAQELLLPEDVVVSSAVQKGAPFFIRDANAVQASEYIVDLGPKTIHKVAAEISRAKTILWNGPVGVFELPPFDEGTIAIAKLLAAATLQEGILTVGGGGDTGAALRAAGVELSYTSTAGGAFLEWLEGKTLPGIAAISHSSKMV
jgi:phosphoglycerate kinase